MRPSAKVFFKKKNLCRGPALGKEPANGTGTVTAVFFAEVTLDFFLYFNLEFLTNDIYMLC